MCCAKLIAHNNMKTKEQVTKEFLSDLLALLDKYGADMETRNHWQGYAECGEDVRITVDIPGIYDGDNNCVREYTVIDLGSWIPHETKTGK